MRRREETPGFKLSGWTTRLTKAWLTVVALTLFASVHSVAVAHDMPSSLIVVRAGDKAASVDVIIPWPELAVAIPQLPPEAPETLDASARTRLDSYLVDHIAFETSGGQIWRTNIEFIEVVGGSDHSDLHATLTLTSPNTEALPFSLKADPVTHEVRNHSIVVLERTSDGRELRLIGSLQYPDREIVLEAQASSVLTSLWASLKLGVFHLLEGPDHLLFLLALLFAAPGVGAASKQDMSGFSMRRNALRLAIVATAFTVGHTISLAIGVLADVGFPQVPVEIGIAISLLIAAGNAWRPIPLRQVAVWLAGGFGFIHGMAFATLLGEYHFSGTSKLVPLLGFNLGIEAAQLLLLAVAGPFIVLLARTQSYDYVRKAGALFIGMAALYWLGQRLRPLIS